MDDYLEFQPPEGADAANGDKALVGVSQHASYICFNTFPQSRPPRVDLHAARSIPAFCRGAA